MMRLYFVLCVFLPINVLAAEQHVDPAGLDLSSMVASLLLVIACIFVFAYLMKKSNLVKTNRSQHQIKVIATQALTSKGRVQIIDVHGQQYLLGVTEQNITVLDKLDKILALEESSEQPSPSFLFSKLLSKISKKNNE